MRKTLIFSVVLLTGCQTADMGGTDAVALVAGNTVTLDDGAVVTYAPSGRYTYRSGGVTAEGTYEIEGSEVCVTFTGGQRRCDRYVETGGEHYLVNAQGDRFRVVSVD